MAHEKTEEKTSRLSAKKSDRRIAIYFADAGAKSPGAMCVVPSIMLENESDTIRSDGYLKDTVLSQAEQKQLEALVEKLFDGLAVSNGFEEV